jgi:hypothetical protein
MTCSKPFCLVLLHGTSALRAEKILHEGFTSPDVYANKQGPHVYLTDTPDIAGHYAELVARQDHSKPAILEITVSERNLWADEWSFDDPPAPVWRDWVDDEDDWYDGIVSHDIPSPVSPRDWATSLEVVHSVLHKGWIPVECIRRAQ